MADKYSFLVIKYPKAETAESALAVLKVLSDDKTVKLRDAVAITKNEKGKIKLHQTKDDSIGKGFVKGGLLGVVFAALFGPVGWIAMGAAAGGLFASFDRGIKNKLLKELGENMTSSESAVAILVEQADWESAVGRMRQHDFGGKLVVSEIVPEDIAEVEKLLEDPKTVASVPEEMDVPAPAAEEAAPAAEEAELAAGYDFSILDGVGPNLRRGPRAVGRDHVRPARRDDARGDRGTAGERGRSADRRPPRRLLAPPGAARRCAGLVRPAALHRLDKAGHGLNVRRRGRRRTC